MWPENNYAGLWLAVQACAGAPTHSGDQGSWGVLLPHSANWAVLFSAAPSSGNVFIVVKWYRLVDHIDLLDYPARERKALDDIRCAL